MFAVLGALLGPTLASFTVTAITTGKAGVQQLLRRYALWRIGLRWYLLVLVGVPLFQLVCSSVFLGIAPLTALIQQWPLYFTTFLPNLLIIVAILTRTFMTWVFNNTKCSILIAILLHAALDASNSGSAFIKHLLTASQLGGYGLASALLFPLVAAVLLLIFTKGRLSYQPDRAQQGVEAPRPEEASSTNI